MKSYALFIIFMVMLGGIVMAQLTPIIQRRMNADLMQIKQDQIQINYLKSDYQKYNSELNESETLDNMENSVNSVNSINGA